MKKITKMTFWLILVIVLSGCTVPTKTGVSEQTVCVDHLSSIKYAFHLIDNPRPIRVHVLIVDLSEDKVEPIVVIAEDSPEENCDAVRVDPRKLAEHPLLQAFVNTNPWTPWGPAYPLDVKISGLAATGGVVYSPHHGVSVWTNKQGRVFIGNPEVAEIQEGAGGFQQILKAAEVVVQQGGDLHPRTAIGVNEDGDRLYLVVVDGRQPGFSEGMSLDELAGFMVNIGCYDAANMDGGGSSVMGIVDVTGKIKILNRPPGPFGSLRPLPIILTIREKQKNNSSNK